MNRLFVFPARYRAFVESQLRLVEAEIQRDIDHRADDDARVRKLATISDTFIDASVTGSLLVQVAARTTTRASFP